MMTSGRWMVERDELAEDEVLQFPLPQSVAAGKLEVSYSELQQAAKSASGKQAVIARLRNAYELTSNDDTLINDAITYTLDYFRRGKDSDACKEADDRLLGKFARTLCTCVNRSFNRSPETGYSAVLYVGDSPMCVAKLSLRASNATGQPEVRRASGELSGLLAKLDKLLMERESSGVYVRRDVRVYDGPRTIYIAKRNQRRLWCESAALREADEIYAEVMRSWGNKK
jgi:hypothetical protein